MHSSLHFVTFSWVNYSSAKFLGCLPAAHTCFQPNQIPTQISLSRIVANVFLE